MDLDMRDCKVCGFRYQPTGRNQKFCGACRQREKEAVRQRRVAPHKCDVCGELFTARSTGRIGLCCSPACGKKRTNRLRQDRFHSDPVYRKAIRAMNVAASRRYRKKQRKVWS